MKETPGDTFRRMAAGEELTPEEIAKVRDFIRIMDGIAWDLEGIIASIKGSGLVFIPGKILAGERNVTIDKNGVSITESTGAHLRWVNAAGERSAYLGKDTGGDLIIVTELTGEDVELYLPVEGALRVWGKTEAAARVNFRWLEDSTAERMLFDINQGTAGLRMFFGDDNVLHSGYAGNTNVINASGLDNDFRIEGDTVTDVFKVDAGEDAVILHSVKTTTGDRTGQEGMLVYNTFDNNIKMYADGAWRTLASW